MRELEGRVAVVTGGGSGIGEALCRACADAGMRVAVADVDAASAERVAAAIGEPARAFRTDVADADSVAALADAVYEAFGACHLLCNNAGVLLFGGVEALSQDDWRWLLSVNLFGVLNGVLAFLPRMRAQGGEAHIVNTASVAAIGGEGGYGASKAAVLSLSESLAKELEGSGIGVSVLLPSYVNSRILDAQRHRPSAFGPRAADPMGTAAVTTGLGPETVAAAALDAVREGRLYVFTYPDKMSPRARAAARFDALLAAIDAGSEPSPW